EGAATRGLPGSDRGLGLPALSVVVGEHLGLLLGNGGEPLGERPRDRAVKLSALAPKQRGVGRVLDERVSEEIRRLGRKAPRVDQLLAGERIERRLQFGVAQREDGLQQRGTPSVRWTSVSTVSAGSGVSPATRVTRARASRRLRRPSVICAWCARDGHGAVNSG